MPTRVLGLDEDSKQALHGHCLSMYLDGECYAFATALSEGLGWPIIGLMSEPDIVRHALVLSPDGNLYDARGLVAREKIGEPFGFSPPYDLRPVLANELLRDGESVEYRLHCVSRARQFAEALWPELPWLESYAKRAIAFCDELEALCRKHNIWIRAPVSTMRPALAKGDADEGGYEIQPTAEGLTFTIERYFS